MAQDVGAGDVEEYILIYLSNYLIMVTSEF
jgi:hypothetical protein